MEIILFMKYRFKLFVFTFLLLFFSQGASAQVGKLFDADKQLSSSFTNQVYLDRDGFIWVVTRNGLNRYDGYKFHLYKKGIKGDNGMASNYVNCMMQDKTGLFYLGMYGALQTYDGVQFRDVEVKSLSGKVVNCYVTSILQRANGDILVGTSGYGLLKLEDRSHAKQLNSTFKDIHTVDCMMEDKKGNLWLATSNKGVLEYDGKQVKTYFKDMPAGTIIKSICEDKRGNVYLGFSNNGVFVKTPGSKQFSHVEVTAGKSVSALFCRRDGKLMIGYDGLGLAVYDPKTGMLTDNPYFSRDVDLKLGKVYSIVEDGSGNIWLGLLQKGIFMQPGEVVDFQYMGYKLGSLNVIGSACVISTLIDSKSRTWVGTDKDGLYVFDSSDRLIKHFKEGFPGSIMTLAEDCRGNIWLGSYNEGFGYINPASMQYRKFPDAAYQNTSAFGMQGTSNDVMWVATMGQGLLRINLNDLQLKAFTAKGDVENNRSLNSIPNDYISKMSVSPDEKRVYLATTIGVCCYDIAKNSWTSFFGKNCLNYGVPTRIAKEYSGKLWIGTNDGLCSYDLKQKKLQEYTVDNGLADNGIASIEQDNVGRLWISTDHGLCCFDPKTSITHNYFADNGLQSNEFSDGASTTSAKGTMLFGGVGGVTWFKPEDISPREWDAKIVLTDLTINGESVNTSTRSGGRQVCDTTVIACDRFDLGYHDNSFALQLSTLTYDNPEHIAYHYSINGEPFVRLQPGNNEITFSHLAPGKYHFRVKAERNQLFTPVREFTVVVHQPWYRSIWATIIYLLIFGALLWFYINYRRRKEKDRMQLQEHIHAEEMADAKLKFFINISHEIRTPMTLIVTPLLSLIKKEKDPQLRSTYETMGRNAERILSLINQMMDLRKIDKGQMQMRMSETDLVGFVKDIYNLFKQQAQAKQITLNFAHDTENLPVWIDRKQFDKVIVNVLSNAFKFTPTGGEINIRVSHDGKPDGEESQQGHAVISINDNGEKIPEDKLDKIFERFYQMPSEANDRNVGTGIGLDLTRSLVELHYGAITAHNLDKGCEFVISIPLGNTHLKPEEMVEPEEVKSDSLIDQLNEVSEPLAVEEVADEKKLSGPISIVVVEDDDEIRDYLSMELAKEYHVITCENGREALTEIYRTMPDLVISDIMMPEMDGNALCAKLKGNPSTNHIPVILLTAKNRDEDKLEGLEAGADAYMEKPFNLDILRRTMVNLIGTHRLMRQKYGRTEQIEQKVDEVKMKSPDEKLLEKVLATINQHLSNSDLSVDMIASEVGISRVHLHRKMKELTGHTPHDFIRSLRLKQAANLLANQKMNIAEVVYACGFSNAASFSTMFKSVYGMSPREYMREQQK